MRAASRPQPVRNTRGGGVTRQTGLGSLLVLLLLAAVTGCGTSIEAAESVDLADTRTALEAQPFIRLRTTMELEADGTRMPLSEYTVLMEPATQRADMDMAGDPAVGVPGARQILMGPSEWYLRADGAPGWIRFDIDPSLTDTDESLARPDGIIEELAAMGVSLDRDGTVEDDGVTYDRYRGSLDWDEYLSTMRSANELSDQFFSQIPPDAEVEGSVTLLLERDGLPHEMVLVMDLTVEGEQARIISTNEYLDTDDAGPIEPPAAEEVDQTVQIDSAEQLERAYQEALTGG